MAGCRGREPRTSHIIFGARSGTWRSRAALPVCSGLPKTQKEKPRPPNGGKWRIDGINRLLPVSGIEPLPWLLALAPAYRHIARREPGFRCNFTYDNYIRILSKFIISFYNEIYIPFLCNLHIISPSCLKLCALRDLLFVCSSRVTPLLRAVGPFRSLWLHSPPPGSAADGPGRSPAGQRPKHHGGPLCRNEGLFGILLRR